MYKWYIRRVNYVVQVEVVEDLVRTTPILSWTKLKMIRALKFALSNNERAYQKLHIAYYEDTNITRTGIIEWRKLFRFFSRSTSKF